MRFSKEMEQSIIVLGALDSSKELLSARYLSEAENFSYEKLSKTLQKMVSAGILNAAKGRQGGYSLNRPLKTISLLNLKDALNDSKRIVPCLDGKICAKQDKCSLLPGVNRFQKDLDGLLEKYSVEEFVQRGER